MCICDSKKTKTAPESMRGGGGGAGGSLLPLLFFFLSPSTPFSPFFPFGFISCLPHFSPTSLHSSTLSFLSPTPCLPSPFPPHLCGHDCCEYHTHICVAQGWKFNILVCPVLYMYDQARMLKN